MPLESQAATSGGLEAKRTDRFRGQFETAGMAQHTRVLDGTAYRQNVESACPGRGPHMVKGHQLPDAWAKAGRKHCPSLQALV